MLQHLFHRPHPITTTFLRPFLLASPSPHPQQRHFHPSLPTPPLPPPTSNVPDVSTFLTRIGRNCITHLPKFPTWEALFLLTPAQLKEAGIEPARTRRYIISWRERYRQYYGYGKPRKGGGMGGKGRKVELVLKEEKRGRKIDGGERRKTMVRAVRASKAFGEERKRREAEMGVDSAAGESGGYGGYGGYGGDGGDGWSGEGNWWS